MVVHTHINPTYIKQQQKLTGERISRAYASSRRTVQILATVFTEFLLTELSNEI